MVQKQIRPCPPDLRESIAYAHTRRYSTQQVTPPPPQVAMERLGAFAKLEPEPPLTSVNDEFIIKRAGASSSHAVQVVEETPREKSEKQQKDEDLLKGTELTVPLELQPLLRDITSGLGTKSQVSGTVHVGLRTSVCAAGLECACDCRSSFYVLHLIVHFQESCSRAVCLHLSTHLLDT